MEVKEASKSLKGLSINGIKMLSTSANSPKISQLKEREFGAGSYRRKLRSSSLLDSSVLEPEININKTEDPVSNNTKQLNEDRSMADTDSKGLNTPAEILLKGLETQNEDLVDAILSNRNAEYINACVASIPVSNLKALLVKLHYRLQHDRKQSSTLSKWLKEIMIVHLHYLSQSHDTAEILKIRLYIESLRVHETIAKLHYLKGLLDLQTQDSSSEESDSENEDAFMK